MKNSTKIFSIIGLLGLAYYLSDKSKSTSKLNSILFIGDSNTFLNYSYAYILKKTFPSIRIKIIAKVGAKTDWMLNELNNELLKSKYDIVSVLGGSNDIYATDSNSMAKKNLDKIYLLVRSNNAKVLAITPPNKNFFIKKTEHKQSELFNLINWIEQNQNKDYFINFWTITNNKSFFSSNDGYLHATLPAHKILASQIISKLQIK